MERLKRRDFFRRTGAFALGVPIVWMTGCGGSQGTGSDTRGMDALSGTLPGSVVRPGDADYDNLRLLYNMRFDGKAMPVGIARCQSASDVAKVVLWARQNQIEIVSRCGGHSYGGYSTTAGLVIDVRRMNGVSLSGSVATVGAGAALIDVYSALTAHGCTIPAGSCPSVGIAGHALGGGYGLASRKLGMVSDNILEVEMVTASGDVLVCNDQKNADLYWACRGGGGGNFGVTTKLTLQAHSVCDTSYFIVDWPWQDAATVLDFWQRWAPSAPDELTSICRLYTTGNGTPAVRVIGQYFGTQAALTALLAPLLDAGVGTPAKKVIAGDTYMNTTLMWAGCNNLTGCHLPPTGQLVRENYRAKSDYVSSLLPPEAIAAAVHWVETRGNIGSCAIMFDAYGGQIRRVAPDATAFVHRDPLFHAQYIGHQTAATEGANLAWLNGFWSDMRPYVSGFAYQNYIDPDLDGWQNAYYGANYDRLVGVKAAYDPDDVFHSAQSIPPA